MEKKFICECGKEFKTLRSLGSHGGHCELYKPRVKKDSKYKKLPINQVVERGNRCAAIADLASFSSGFPWSL